MLSSMLHLESIDDKKGYLSQELAAAASIQREEHTQSVLQTQEDSLYEDPSQPLLHGNGGDPSILISNTDQLNDIHEGLEQQQMKYVHVENA